MDQKLDEIRNFAKANEGTLDGVLGKSTLYGWLLTEEVLTKEKIF